MKITEIKSLSLLSTLLLSVFIGLGQLSAQTADSKGTDFWVAFQTNFTPELSLFISSETGAIVEVNAGGSISTYTVPAGSVVRAPIPANLQMAATDGVENKGIHVTSNNEVTVYALNQQYATTDAFLALPTDILGTEYIAMAYGAYNDQLAVIATINNTVVSITPSVTIGSRTAGVAYNISLNAGEVYQLRGNNISGTKISANHPIGVFGGNQCINIGNGACDHIAEQLPPVSAWGKNFVALGLQTRPNSYIKILAADDNTVVEINGNTVATLNSGQTYQAFYPSYVQITSSKPVLVGQFAPGNGTSTGDPFFMMIPPYEQYLANYTVATPVTNFTEHYLNIIVPSSGINSITLDGSLLPATSFSAIGSSGFYGGAIQVSAGNHNVKSTYPIGVHSYGWGFYDSYGYPGGQSLSPIAFVSNLSLSPQTATIYEGAQQCFTTTITDNQNNPVAGIRVDFAVSGANSASGFANTNASGNASFCYTPTTSGTDNVESSSGSLSGSAVVSVLPCTLSASGIATNIYCGAASGGSIDITASSAAGGITYAWSTGATSEDLSGLAPGNYQVVVSDANACTETLSFSISQQTDDVLPIATVQNVTVQLDANGQASIVTPATSIVLFTEKFTADADQVAYADITNWIVNGAGGIDVGNWSATIPGKEVDLAGFSNSSITTKQSFNLSPGNYSLSFDHVRNTTDSPFSVAVGNLTSQTFTATANVQSESMNFTVGAAESVQLTFTQLGNGGASGSFVGNIVLTELVPASFSINNGSNDNCDIASISASKINFSCADLGDNSVILTVTDLTGNSAAATATVTVEDNILPVVVGNNLSVNLDNTGNYSLSQADIDAMGAGSTDNCSVALSISNGNTSYSCTDAGQSFTLTLTGTDAAGNTASTPVVLNITDNNSVCNDPPLAVCQTVTLNADEDCAAMLVATDVNGGSSDPDGDALTYTLDNYGPFGIGTHTVSLTVSDGEYSDVCTTTITVQDITPPIIQGENNNLTMTFDAGAGAPASYTEAGITFLSLYGSTSHVHLGDNNYDGSNDILNHSGCCSTPYRLTVGANTEFTLISMDVKSVSGNPTFYVYPSGASVTITGPGTFTFPAGFEDVTEVRWAQNAGTMVIDNLVLSTQTSGSCPKDIVVANDPGACGAVVNFSANALDNCSASVSFNPASGSLFPIGTTQVTATATDPSGNSSSCSFDVTVNDTEAPIALAQGTTVQLDVNGNASITANDINAGSTDNCGIGSISVNPSTFSCVNVGANNVTLTVTDVNGNTSIANALVVVEDVTPPAALSQNITIQLDANGQASITAADVDAGSNDVCGIASLSVSPSSFNCANTGTNQVTLTVTDANGNTSTASATVTVQDNVDPIALAQNITVQLNANGEASIAAADVDAGSNDACGIASLSVSPANFNCGNVGANNVILTVTDPSGNVSTVSTTVTVEDNVDPVALAQSITVQLDANGQASITAADVDAGSNDACGIASLSVSPSSFTCVNTGGNTVTLTVVDVNGNSSSTLANVTVEDNILPTITCGANISVIAQPNDCSPIVNWTVPVAADNCSFTVNSTHNPGDRFNEGVTVVTYTATDASGNSTSCSFNVTITSTPLTLSLSATTYASGWNISCKGESDGSIDATAGGGCLPYTYSWSNGSTSEDISTLSAGSYTLSMTDAKGRSITKSITLSEPNVLAVTASSIGYNQGNGFSGSTIYLGYGNQSVSLNTNVTGGTAAYSYSWSPATNLSATTGATVIASPQQSTTYTVIVTDQNGCTATHSVHVDVVDARCGNKMDKVLVCHKESKSKRGVTTTSYHNICVSANAVAAHLAHGDYVGPCNNSSKTEVTEEALEVAVYPNPTSGSFNVRIHSHESGSVRITVFSMNGQLMRNISESAMEGNNEYRLDLSTEAAGLYMIKVETSEGISTIKLMKD